MPRARKTMRTRRVEEDREPRLFLSIRDHWYQVEALETDPREPDRAYRLNKDDGQRYDVTDSRFGPICDCPDFLFRRDGIDPRGCKHVRALRRYGLLGPEKPVQTLASDARRG